MNFYFKSGITAVILLSVKINSSRDQHGERIHMVNALLLLPGSLLMLEKLAKWSVTLVKICQYNARSQLLL